LRALDARLDATETAGLSLDPRAPGRRATRLDVLISNWVSSSAASSEGVDEGLKAALASALADVSEALLEAFPGNLFWDVDGVFGELARVGSASADEMRALAGSLAELMHLFGGDSAIRFQYVHDFVYGFDWADWVRREPRSRAEIGPFDARYVARTKARGQELLELIAADDEQYPKVPEGEYRNPFSFVRTPTEERRLFESLAAAGVVPSPAWRQDAPAEWRREYDAERERIAQELGLSAPSQG
jgi:hypothetical protein